MFTRFQLDTRSLALFRMALGWILLVDLGIRVTDLEAHYTDDGIIPRSALEQIAPIGNEAAAGYPAVSLHTKTGGKGSILFLFGLQAVSALLLLLGWRTRAMNIVCWFLLMSLQARNPLVLNGADHLLRLLLFFGIFLPLGSMWSLDDRQGRGGALPSSAACFAILVQVCLVYISTVFLKTDSAWRSDFTAGIIALQADFYVTPLGDRLTAFPSALKAATAAVFGWEALGPLLLLIGFPFRRFRLCVLLLFSLLHIGMGACLELGLWTWVSLAALLPFLPFHRLDSESKTVSMDWKGRAALVSTAAALWINLAAIRPQNIPMPAPVQSVLQAVGLDQRWDMFAPYPLMDDGWFVMAWVPGEGSPVNLLHPGLPTDETKPVLYSQEFSNHRWRKLFLRLRRDSADPYLPHVAGWISRHPAYFGAAVPAGPGRVELRLYQEITEWDGNELPPEVFLLFSEHPPAPAPQD